MAPSKTPWTLLLGTLIFSIAIALPDLIRTAEASSDRNHDHDHRNVGKQTWGYVEVRPGAHMFWWLYYTTSTEDYTKKPLVLWLQGGPGASSSGFGNFAEIGPLDVSLLNRSRSWVNYTNVLFVDNPVGSGYSYVNDSKLLVKNNTEIVADLMELITKFLFKVPEFQTVPLYIFSESYGGKMATQFTQRLYKTIQKGKVKCNLKGVALGDSWISPIDSVLSWGQYLFSTSLIDNAGLASITASAEATKAALDQQKYEEATKLFESTQDVISKATNGVNFYNILQQDPDGTSAGAYAKAKGLLRKDLLSIGSHQLAPYHGDKLSDLMNGPIKQKLKIIPANVTWGGQSAAVFAALAGDFMRPVVLNVESLLNNTPVQVSVYSGQLDLIVNTIGTTTWVEGLNWAGIGGWRKSKRQALTITHQNMTETEGFVKSYGNFNFYWILKAGHMVPADAPETAAEMLQLITALKKPPTT